MLSVIGIHAKIDDHGKVSATSGHAWLTVHFTNGRRDSVGLWPEREDGLARLLIRDQVGFSKSTEEKLRVSWGKEIQGHYKPFASRYYGLRQGEQNKAISCIGGFTGWRIESNCTSWATEKIKEIFGVSIQHSEFLGLHDSPRALGAALARLETVRRTVVNNPFYPLAPR
jgi:hypothetical protein